MASKQPPVPLPADMDTSITLTAAEERVFAVLRQTGRNLGTTVRIAGGWVRDKLLGKPSDDVDVALDNCSGIAFATEVNKVVKSQGGRLSKVRSSQRPPKIPNCSRLLQC